MNGFTTTELGQVAGAALVSAGVTGFMGWKIWKVLRPWLAKIGRQVAPADHETDDEEQSEELDAVRSLPMAVKVDRLVIGMQRTDQNIAALVRFIPPEFQRMSRELDEVRAEQVITRRRVQNIERAGGIEVRQFDRWKDEVSS